MARVILKFFGQLTFPCLLLFLSLIFPPFAGGHDNLFILPNGLSALLLNNPGTSSVAIDLWVKAGSRYDPPGKSGLAHLVEHLLFKGTKARTAQDISREIAALGGKMNAYTLWDYTQYHILVLPQYVSKALDILADIVQNSLFTEEMIEKEKKVILEEISLANIYPPSYILNLISRTLFQENQLGQPIMGTKETVTNIKREEVIQFFKSHYLPHNSYLTVVGNLEAINALELIKEKFNSWPKETTLPPSPPSPSRQHQFQEVRKRRFLDQAIVVIALQATSWSDEDRPAFEIINALLGAGAHSRLYQEIREKNALSYLVGSIYYPLSDTGIWATYAGTNPGNIKKIKSIFWHHLKKIQEEPLSPEELSEIKNYLHGRTLMRLENNSNLAEFLGPQLLITGQFLSPAEYLSQIQKVNVQDVQRVAQKYFREENLCLFILKPYPGLRILGSLF